MFNDNQMANAVMFALPKIKYLRRVLLTLLQTNPMCYYTISSLAAYNDDATLLNYSFENDC